MLGIVLPDKASPQVRGKVWKRRESEDEEEERERETERKALRKICRPLFLALTRVLLITERKWGVNHLVPTPFGTFADDSIL